jgi:hypothetical protein
MLCFLFFGTPILSRAEDRVRYDFAGTLRAADPDLADLNERSFLLQMLVNTDAVPVYASDSLDLSVATYDAVQASLIIDGAPISLERPQIIIIDWHVPVEPDQLLLVGLWEFEPGTNPIISFQHEAELTAGTLLGTRPQPFSFQQVARIPDVVYMFTPNCPPGTPCPGGAADVDYRVENAHAVGILVPEPASVFIAIAAVATLARFLRRRK